MKKISALLLTLIFSIGFVFYFTSAPKKVSAQDGRTQVVTDTYKFLEEFVTSHPDRTSFSQKELDTAQWIEQKFNDFGLESKIQSFDADYNNKTVKSQNVVGVLDNGKEKQVIICAHYDNIYGSDLIKGYQAEGAYNNGSGVAVMFALAQYFGTSSPELDFNIIFLALGAEEPGLYGSKYYESQMLPSQKSDTLLVIDLDCVGGGDYLYLYCDEVNTIHQQFIKNIADNNNLALRLPPSNKKTFTASTPLTPYLHYGLNSANLYFLKSGINSAHFFSRNWDTNKKIGVVESQNHPSIIYTENDNLKTLQEYYGDTFIQKMDTAADIIYYTLTDSNFVSGMQNSAAQKSDYSLLINRNLVTFIKLGLLIVMGVIVLLLLRRFINRYPVPVIKIRQVPPAVFGDEYEKNKESDLGNKKEDNNPKNPFDGY